MDADIDVKDETSVESSFSLILMVCWKMILGCKKGIVRRVCYQNLRALILLVPSFIAYSGVHFLGY